MAEGKRSLRRRAIENIVTNLPFVDIDNVRVRVTYMDIDELQWTIDASAADLQDKARSDADRLARDMTPLNPWWYK